MPKPAHLAATLAGQILFVRPDAGLEISAFVAGLQPRAESRPGLLSRLLGRGADVEALREPPTAPMVECPLWMGEPDATGSGWALKDGVARIHVEGALWPDGFGWGDWYWHGYDTLSLAFEEIAADTRVRGVFVYYKTPGGVLAPSLPELARQIREGSARAGGKPVWSFCEAAYSAGYWLAAQGDRVIAPREGGVGSIGSYIEHWSYARALQENGVDVTYFEDPAGKTDGQPLKVLSDSAKAHFQARAVEGTGWFFDDVIAARPVFTAETLRAQNAGAYFGDAANPDLSGLRHQLVDAVMTEREAFAALVAEVSLSAASAAAANQEFNMNRSTVMAALATAGLTATQLGAASTALIAAEAAEAAEAEASGEDTAADSTTSGDDTAGESVAGAEGDDALASEPAADALAPTGATVLAILALPEAKGRETLAQALAGAPGMTAAQAKTLLGASPKKVALAYEDPNVAPTGGDTAAATGPEAEGRALAALANAQRNPARK